MKAMLMGHVPPARVDSKMSWDETCWQKYTLWQKQYRDVIVGNFYGHMNIDHFMLQDFKDIKKSFKKGYAPAEMDEPKAKHAADEGLSVMSATEYLIDLRDYFSKIPSISEKLRIWEDDDEADSSWLESVMGIFKGKNGREKHGKKPQNPLSKIGGEYGERYSLSFVQPSVIPNFFPTLRVFEYNITGLGDLKFDASTPPETASKLSEELFNARSGQVPILAGTRKPSFIDEFVEDPTLSSSTSGKDVDEEKKKKNRKKNKYKFKVPKAPSKSTPPGPAYSPQTLSLLGYTQYFANITHINIDFLNANAEREEDVGEAGWKEGKHSGKTKKGKPHPKKFKYKVEYDTFSDKIFGLKDLTVRSYIDLAKIIGDSEHATQRSEFDGDVEETVDVAVEVDASKNGGKKKKEKKAKKKSNKVWHAFIKRAFVGTIDPEEIEERFLVWKSASSLEQNGTTPSVPGGSLEL
jgi:endopolyphosphatase